MRQRSLLWSQLPVLMTAGTRPWIASVTMLSHMYRKVKYLGGSSRCGKIAKVAACPNELALATWLCPSA